MTVFSIVTLKIKPMEKTEYTVDLADPDRAYVIGRQTRGRKQSIEVPVDDQHISRRHCKIKWASEDGWTIRDLNTTNGTMLNGELAFAPAPLPDKSEILIGTTRITVAYSSGDGATKSNQGMVGDSRTWTAPGADWDFSFTSPGWVDPRLARDGDIDVTQVLAGERDPTVAGPSAAGDAASLDRAGEAPAAAPAGDGATGILDAARAPIPSSDDDFDVTLVLAGERDPTVAGPSAAGDAASLDRAGEAPAAAPAGDDVTGILDAPRAPVAAAAAAEETQIAAATTTEETQIAAAATTILTDMAPTMATPAIDGTVKMAPVTRVPKIPLSRGGDGQHVATPPPRKGLVLEETAPARKKPEERIEFVGIARDLIDSNLLDEGKARNLAQHARDQGQTFFRALADDPSVRFKDEIYDLVSRKLSLALINEEKAVDEEVTEVDWLPFPIAETMGVVVLEPETPGSLRYATIDPFDIVLDDWITRCAGTSPIEKVIVAPKPFYAVMSRLKNRANDSDTSEIGVAVNITMEQERKIRSNVEALDVPQIVNFFLHRGFVQGASDIHIEPTEGRLMVRNRVDGILHEDTTLPRDLHPEIASRVKILASMDVAEKRRPQDGRIGASIRGTAIDVRVSSYPTVYGEKIVMRLLDKNTLRPSPESLGFRAGGLRLLKDKINAPFGLMMISGPTGSGKTTTLYSCLGSIDKTAKNVLTIEDPVEYRLRGVHQMQVNEKIGLTFASGLRTILRQDPDVIMVGECRDVETAQMAIQAALTGHIVFSTIHTNDSIGVVTRLLDMGIDAFLVANALSLTIAQRLVRVVCRHCRVSVPGDQILKTIYSEGISDERLAFLGITVEPDLSYVQGAGCIHCRSTGYLGRRPVFEMFEMTSEARALILSANFNADALRSLAQKSKMTTVLSHGLILVDEGVTTHQEVLRVLGEAY